MSAEVSRREFLYGAEAVMLASLLNLAYAHAAPEDLAGDEEFWKKIRSAYVRDPKLINLNNGGVAPAPTSVLDAEIEAIRYSNRLPAYRMWHDLEPGIEDVRKRLAQMWNADPECVAITRNASESLQIAQFGLDLQPGDEVLTTSQDYPRMITTWQQRERREPAQVALGADRDRPVVRAQRPHRETLGADGRAGIAGQKYSQIRRNRHTPCGHA